MTRKPDRQSDLTPLGEILTPKLKRKLEGKPALTPIQARLQVPQPEDPDVLYQHTVLCQTCLPYRDPGDERTWERSNGHVDLLVEAGKLKDPNGAWVQQGLPFGTKSRVILMHINQRAMLSPSPQIDVGDSFTGFVCDALVLDPTGRNLRVVKDQLNRLSAASIMLGAANGERAITDSVKIVRRLELWGFKKDARQRVLWPDVLTLSLDYFEDLKEHAVPLNEPHIRALSHNCMALDIYAWLAQRLHRVSPIKPVPISWLSLWHQFGQGYNQANIRNFRRDFRTSLKQVLTQYRTARVADRKPRFPARPVRDRSGKLVIREPLAEDLLLYHSPPPVPPRPLIVVPEKLSSISQRD